MRPAPSTVLPPWRNSSLVYQSADLHATDPSIHNLSRVFKRQLYGSLV